VLLVSHESWRVCLQVSNALQVVLWIEWILWRSNRLELDTLWFGPFNVFNSQGVFYLVEADMEVSRHRSLNVVILEIEL
jgi:hypothetical protein